MTKKEAYAAATALAVRLGPGWAPYTWGRAKCAWYGAGTHNNVWSVTREDSGTFIASLEDQTWEAEGATPEEALTALKAEVLAQVTHMQSLLDMV